ncbi:MAG: hypothetical protein HKN08_07030 [Gammaproteobacteria bacterium]|nr:hypothetical protein [Gammaproteobacteria bacterium]
MRKPVSKFILTILVVLGISAPPVFAHLSGVFAYFVQDMDQPSAGTRLLQQQLDSVGDRITRLEPEVEQARSDYYDQADTAVRRMRFYDVYVGSAIGALWAGAQDPIDVLASTELMQKRLTEDLESLADLQESYVQLQGKEDSLRRYASLLEPFKVASQSRDERMTRLPGGLVSPFAEPYIAYRIAEDWEVLRGTTFTLFFNWAQTKISGLGIGEVLNQSQEFAGAWLLEEEVLNALVGGDGFPFMEDAKFYIRADHVNFSARIRSSRDIYNLLTVGQLERTGPAKFQYRIEGIFMDGMPLDPNDPDIQREVYRGQLLGIDLSPLMPPEAQTASFEQRNGYIVFRVQ